MCDDWMKVIRAQQDAFLALLFRPSNGTYELVDDETDLAEINNNQRNLIYEEPELVWVIDNPNGRESFQVIDGGGEQDGITDDVMVLRVASKNFTAQTTIDFIGCSLVVQKDKQHICML